MTLSQCDANDAILLGKVGTVRKGKCWSSWSSSFQVSLYQFYHVNVLIQPENLTWSLCDDSDSYVRAELLGLFSDHRRPVVYIDITCPKRGRRSRNNAPHGGSCHLALDKGLWPVKRWIYQASRILEPPSLVDFYFSTWGKTSLQGEIWCKNSAEFTIWQDLFSAAFSAWWFQLFLEFSSLFGEDCHWLLFLQRSRNHQLVQCFAVKMGPKLFFFFRKSHESRLKNPPRSKSGSVTLMILCLKPQWQQMKQAAFRTIANVELQMDFTGRIILFPFQNSQMDWKFFFS